MSQGNFKMSLCMIGILALLSQAACGGSGGGAASGSASSVPATVLANSLTGVVYGRSDYSAPTARADPAGGVLTGGALVGDTMMRQMKNLFDRIKDAPDFTQVVMDLGDGAPVHVLDTNTGDKFLPGKLAMGLSYILIDMKKKGDPAYPAYLAAYQRVTSAMITPMNPAKPTNYLYANTSFGEYYYLIALNNFKDSGMLGEVFGDTLLATLKSRLNFCDMFGADASGATNTCPASGTPIDIRTLNTAQNYYGVSYGIAGLRQRLGWDNPGFTSSDGSEATAIAGMGARDALLYKLTTHIRNDSSGGFSDEAGNTSTTAYDQARYDRYSTLLIAEVTERSLEADNQANLTPELKGYLRNSVDLILPQLNVDGKGFNYGRSIGPYGDSAFVEILTAAANAGVLSKEEMDVAYAFVYKAALRLATYWYDPTLPTPSINMWVKGRGTDGYRGKARALGENFSLLHQYLYVNKWWTKLGYAGRAPMSDAALQAWLDGRQPHARLTWYNLPGDTAHPYGAALITVRDKKRVINLNLSQAPNYNHFTPYLPVPFADSMIYGTTDQSYPLLVPQINYGGTNYLPVTYYRNLAMVEDSAAGTVTVSFDAAKYRKAAKDPAYTTDLDAQVHTSIVFRSGSITRTDTLSSATLTGNATVTTDFTSFARFADASVGVDAFSASFANSDVTAYRVTGFDSCALSNFSTSTTLSSTPIGPLGTKFSCTTGAFALSAAGRNFSWNVQYRDLP